MRLGLPMELDGYVVIGDVGASAILSWLGLLLLLLLLKWFRIGSIRLKILPCWTDEGLWVGSIHRVLLLLLLLL